MLRLILVLVSTNFAQKEESDLDQWFSHLPDFTWKPVEYIDRFSGSAYQGFDSVDIDLGPGDCIFKKFLK